MNKDHIERCDAEGLSAEERAKLARLRKEIAELRRERYVLKRSVVQRGKEATR